MFAEFPTVIGGNSFFLLFPPNEKISRSVAIGCMFLLAWFTKKVFMNANKYLVSILRFILRHPNFTII